MIIKAVISEIIISNIIRHIISYLWPFFDWASLSIFINIYVIVSFKIYLITIGNIIITPCITRNIRNLHVLYTLVKIRSNICRFLNRNKKAGRLNIHINSPAIIFTTILIFYWYFSNFWSIVWTYTLYCSIICIVIRKFLINNQISIAS